MPDALRRAARREAAILRSVFRPPVRMTGTQWADGYRVLSPEASATPGKYDSGRAPYQREPLDAICDPLGGRVVLMWPSQVGKTEVVNNAIGQRMHLRPGPLLVLQPTLQMAEDWSKDRLAPMIRDTPALRRLVADARTRDSGNTLLHKSYPGGHITVVGANSAAGLASRPIRDVFCDEVDRYPESAGAEGDPVSLAFRRTATFGNAGHVLISTPTIKGASRIEKAFAESDQRQYFVPCPHCGEFQVLRWGGRDAAWGLKWEPGKPETAYYVCEPSGCEIEEMFKAQMLAGGEWRAMNPGHATRGYWLNGLYSPFDGARWGKLVAEFLEVKADPLRLRPFVNTVLCETWEDEGARLDAHLLMDRLGKGYPEPGEDAESLIPMRAGVLTAAVDVQDDRLEWAIYAWGDGEEGWLIGTGIVSGDPGTDAPWTAVDQILLRTHRHESGAELGVAATFVDSGGHHTKSVYAFTRPRVGRRVFAIKGSSQEGAPLLGRPSRNNSAKAILYMVGSFTGKESVMSRFAKVKEPGPGFLHLPLWLDSEQLNQFTNEKLITKIVHGRAKRLWLKTGRNEQLDLLVYASAALQVLGLGTVRRLGAIAAQLAEAAQSKPVPKTNADGSIFTPPKAPRRRGGWVNGW